MKSWPSRQYLLVNQLLVYQLLSMVRPSPSQLLPITIFTSEKAKTAKDVLNRKSLLLAHLLLLPPRYDFYEQKSEKLAVASQSAGTPAALYGTSVSKPAAPNYDFYGQKSKNS